MEHQAVSSSNLKSVAYDADSAVLQIRFSHGGLYNYFKVPKNVWQGLMSASSHGQYFNAYIKDVYECRKVR